MTQQARPQRFSIRRVAIVVVPLILLSPVVWWFGPGQVQRREMAATKAWADAHVVPVLAKDLRFVHLEVRPLTFNGAPLAITGEIGGLRDLRDLRDTVRATEPPMAVMLIVQYPDPCPLTDDELIEWMEITGKWMQPAATKK